jgi:hypothetical protein
MFAQDFELDDHFVLDYIETSITAGMTINEYRRSRPRRPTRGQRIRRSLGRAARSRR